MDDFQALEMTTEEEDFGANWDLLDNSISRKIKTLKTKSDCYSLPPAHVYFSSPEWMLEPMRLLKDDLNKVKSRLNDFRVDEWHLHTRNMNPLSSVIKEIRTLISHEFCTVAWCKLFEILSVYQAIPRAVEEAAYQLNEIGLSSVHLCEAPGAFLAALNHYLQTKQYSSVAWDWLATTLSPYYEGNERGQTLIQDHIILSTLPNWSFLEDNTGNIMSSKNILSLRAQASKLRTVQLVTADGSIDCANAPEDQETLTSDLHFCEIVAALMVLHQGGSLVLKMFTFFEGNSISKLYLLACFFDEVEIVKPAMSKEGNSEVYAICRGFAGQHMLQEERTALISFCDQVPKGKCLFPQEAIPPSFLERVVECSLYFATEQARVISRNVKTFEFGPSFYRMMGNTKSALAKQWFQMTGLQSLSPKNFLLNLDKTKKKYYFVYSKVERFTGSYNERLSLAELKSQPTWISNIVDNLKLLESHIPYAPVQTELPKYSSSMSLSYGKPFENIKGSRFCDDKVLQLSQTVREYVGLRIQHSPDSAPTLPEDPSGAEMFSPGTKILCYNLDDINGTLMSDLELAQYFFPRLVQTLNELQAGENLFLSGYPLLTRFNFGVAILLHSFFHQGLIYCQRPHEMHSEVSLGILLLEFKGLMGPQVGLWSELQEIFATYGAVTPRRDQMLLELFPVAFLCRKDVCEIANAYNNQLLLKNLRWKTHVAELITSASFDVEMQSP